MKAIKDKPKENAKSNGKDPGIEGKGKGEPGGQAAPLPAIADGVAAVL